MALQDLLDAIATEADRESVRLLRDSEREADRIRREAAAEASAIRASILASRAATTRAEVDRRLAAARQQASRLRREIDEQVFGELLSQARVGLSAVHSDREYPAVLTSLLHEALGAVADADTVRVSPRDVAAVRAAAEDAGLAVVPDPDIDEGVVVTSAGGRSVRNSLASRLAAAEPDLRRWYHSRIGRPQASVPVPAEAT